MHGRGEQDLGLVLLPAGIVGNCQRPQPMGVNQVGGRTEVHEPAERRVVDRELMQEGLVLLIARVTGPRSVEIIHPSLAAHRGFLGEGRRGYDLPSPSRRPQLLELPRHRGGPYIVAANVLDADQTGEPLEL
jgi:hypothetical protein